MLSQQRLLHTQLAADFLSPHIAVAAVACSVGWLAT